MLPPHLEALTKSIESNERFSIMVKTHEGDGYASLGLDLIGLDAVLECVGIAEVATAYWMFESGDLSFSAYSPNMLSEFGGMISGSNSPENLMDAFTSQDHWLDVYHTQIAQRRGGRWAVGDGEILRVELVELYKENPTVKQILVTGFAGTLIFLGGTFGWVHVKKENGAQQCQQQFLEYGQKGREPILKQAKLEGRLTEHHEKALQAIENTVTTGIAACGSKLDEIDAGIDITKEGIALHVTASTSNEPEKRHH